MAAAKAAGAITLNYGAIIDTLVNLVIVGFVLFMLVAVNTARKPAPAPPALTPEDVLLLLEIRDALKK